MAGGGNGGGGARDYRGGSGRSVVESGKWPWIHGGCTGAAKVAVVVAVKLWWLPQSCGSVDVAVKLWSSPWSCTCM